MFAIHLYLSLFFYCHYRCSMMHTVLCAVHVTFILLFVMVLLSEFETSNDWILEGFVAVMAVLGATMLRPPMHFASFHWRYTLTLFAVQPKKESSGSDNNDSSDKEQPPKLLTPHEGCLDATPDVATSRLDLEGHYQFQNMMNRKQSSCMFEFDSENQQPGIGIPDQWAFEFGDDGTVLPHGEMKRKQSQQHGDAFSFPDVSLLKQTAAASALVQGASAPTKSGDDACSPLAGQEPEMAFEQVDALPPMVDPPRLTSASHVAFEFPDRFEFGFEEAEYMDGIPEPAYDFAELDEDIMGVRRPSPGHMGI